MKIILLVSSIILTLISCNNSNQSKELPIQWETLIIESSNQIITIDRYEEYAVNDTCDFTEIKDGNNIIYKPINRGQEYFNVSQQDKDSLFKYIYEIVTKPVYKKQFASCYVGNISIGFRTSNTTLICKYNSVGNWATISPQMQKLHSLLEKKTRLSAY